MMETRTILRTISEQLSKLLTTSPVQNLLVFFYKKAYIWSILGVISYCCCSYEYLRTIETQIVQKPKNNEAR